MRREDQDILYIIYFRAVMDKRLLQCVVILMLILDHCHAHIFTTKIGTYFDDVFEENNGNIANTAPYISQTVGSIGAYRFPLNVPNKANIAYATLKLGTNWASNPSTIQITIQDVPDAQPISYHPYSVSSRKFSTQRVRVQMRAQKYGQIVSADISVLINRVVMKQEWSAGNHILFAVYMVSPGEEFEVISFEGTWNDPGILSAQLQVNYNTQSIPPPQSIIEKPKQPLNLSIEQKKQFLHQQRLSCLKQHDQTKIPIILVIDDLQTQYLESISFQITSIHIAEQVDILLDVIPNNIETSFVLKHFLPDWQDNYPCLLEIGEHGFTHNGDEYQMDSISYQRQVQIVQNGTDNLWKLGLVANSFTPPGGRDGNNTFKVLSQREFHTSIDWERKDWSVSTGNVTLFENIFLCEGSWGNILGPDCQIKSAQALYKEIDEQYYRLGYSCIGYHIQDFISYDMTRDHNKIQAYKQTLRTLKQSNKYEFMLPQEYYLWKQQQLTN